MATDALRSNLYLTINDTGGDATRQPAQLIAIGQIEGVLRNPNRPQILRLAEIARMDAIQRELTRPRSAGREDNKTSRATNPAVAEEERQRAVEQLHAIDLPVALDTFLGRASRVRGLGEADSNKPGQIQLQIEFPIERVWNVPGFDLIGTAVIQAAGRTGIGGGGGVDTGQVRERGPR